MVTEVVKVKTKLDTPSVNEMVNTLNTRFANVAKKFSSGIGNAIKGGLKGALFGGAVGAGMGVMSTLLERLINPLEATQDAINKFILRADDLAGLAAQFGTSPSTMLRLQTFAQAKGLDPQTLSMMMSKFQVAIAEARADVTKDTSVRKYAMEEDIGVAFLNFVQSLKGMKPEEQTLVQKEIFGEKAILQMSSFLKADFRELAEQLKFKPADVEEAAIRHGEQLRGLQTVKEAGLNYNDFLTKSGITNAGQVNADIERKRVELQAENKRIESYESLKNLNINIEKLNKFLETKLIDLMNYLDRNLEVQKQNSIGEALYNFSGLGEYSKNAKVTADTIKEIVDVLKKSQAMRGVVTSGYKDK